MTADQREKGQGRIQNRRSAWRVNVAAMGLTLAVGALAPAQADRILFWNHGGVETLEAMSRHDSMASGRDLSMLNDV